MDRKLSAVRVHEVVCEIGDVRRHDHHVATEFVDTARKRLVEVDGRIVRDDHVTFGRDAGCIARNSVRPDVRSHIFSI